MVEETIDALVAQIYSELQPAITDLTVAFGLLRSPSAPCIDVYPSSEGFFERLTMGDDGWEFFLDVRARVSSADHEGQQRMLIRMMDPTHATSLTAAIESDSDLGGIIDSLHVVDGPTGFGTFNDPGSVDNRLLGALWRVQVIP